MEVNISNVINIKYIKLKLKSSLLPIIKIQRSVDRVNTMMIKFNIPEKKIH